ncbi:MAG: hypothetical protein ACLPTQ_18220, partial [Terriglobales bacterium]
TSNCCSSFPRMPSSYQVVLWKQESFVVLRPLHIEFFRNLLGSRRRPPSKKKGISFQGDGERLGMRRDKRDKEIGMATSEKKLRANRVNGRKSHGPMDSTSTRFNATKHGLLAMGITELDDAEGCRALLDDLRKEKAPVGVVETLLVESVALDMIRLRRARRLEAEYIIGELNPPTIQAFLFDLPDLSKPTILDPGLPAVIGFESGQRLVNVFQRYETTFVTRILRLLHELERLQRMRGGERLPAPAVVDVSVHASASSLPEPLENSADIRIANSIPAELKPPTSPSDDVDVDDHADAGIGDSVPKTLGQPKPIPGGSE